MNLNPPPRQTMRVHELAAELGWTSRQLIAEFCRRGEYVKSAASALEAPVVRDIQRDFAAISRPRDVPTERHAAVARRGLHSCPQMAWSQVRNIVAEIVSPPDELMLFCGMSIGYEDVAVDYIRTGRAPLVETVTFIEG
jgi:nitroreductase